jgi:hypothetical protein
MKLARAPKYEPAVPPTARDVFRARVKLHEIAGRLELQDAIFVRHIANKILPLVPVVEEPK